MKKELGQTIKKLRILAGLTQEQLAQKVGVTKANVSKYEAGAHAPEMERLARLADVLGVSVSELMRLAERGGNFNEGPDIEGTVPLIDWVQAGQWREMAERDQSLEVERVATTWRTRRYTFALRVQGDSMEPRFPDGCIIIVEPDEDAMIGSFVIARQNGSEATFKQLIQDGGKRFLKPLNPRYPIMELQPDAVICGVVKRVEMDV
jgi:SOS-response transcriptional repressor LexA